MSPSDFFDLAFGDALFLAVAVATGALIVAALVFTAVAVWLRVRNDREQARQHRREEHWGPLLHSVMAGRRSSGFIRANVARSDRYHFVEYVFHFARRRPEEDVETLTTVVEPFLGRVVASLQDDDLPPERRARCIQILGFFGGRDYTKRYLQSLDDPSPLVAMAAARVLSKPIYAEHAGAVIDHLPRFRLWSVKSLSALLVGMGREAAPSIRDLLADEQAARRLRAVAADALRRLEDPASVETAVRVLKESDDSELKGAVLRLLGELGTSKHAFLVRQYTGAADDVVRINAIRALSQVGQPEEADYLRAAMDDASRWVAIHAAQGLKRLGRSDLLDEVAASDHPWAGLAREVLSHRRIAA